MFNTSLENAFVKNILTFALIMLVSQITIVLGMKILVLLLLPITLRIHHLNKVSGVAFSLIMIMLQTKFFFVRVHPPAISNIQ